MEYFISYSETDIKSMDQYANFKTWHKKSISGSSWSHLFRLYQHVFEKLIQKLQFIFIYPGSGSLPL